jgi:hypothetical protein
LVGTVASAARETPGVAQVLVADLGVHLEDLFPPPVRVGFGQDEFGAEPSDDQVVDVGLVDHVRVQRGRAGAQFAGDGADRQRVVALGLHDAQCGVDDAVDGEGLAARCGAGGGGAGLEVAGRPARSRISGHALILAFDVN